MTMASKANFLFLFASFLLLLSPTTFSSNEDQLLEGEVRSPPLVPVRSTPTPTPAPPLKSPPVIPPAPSPAPVYKQPTPTPPPAPKAKSPASPPPPPPAYKAPPPPPRPKNTKDCYPLCLVRCKLHSRIKICLRACVTCCDRCKCVPPGQYGNYDKCPKCYANMTTHDGRRKCP